MEITFTLTIFDHKDNVLSAEKFETLKEAQAYRSGFYQIRDNEGTLIEAQW